MGSQSESVTTKMLAELSAKGNAKAKAIIAISEIGDSMRETGAGNSPKSRLLKAAAVMEENGDAEIAAKYRQKAATMPDSTRGVGWEEAAKRLAPHLQTLEKDFDDVVKNGIGAVKGKVSYALGVEFGYFEKKNGKKDESETEDESEEPETEK